MSTAKFDTLSNLAGTLTIPVDTVAQGTARAWVNFNGTGTVAIRAAFNVTSITDGGTGIYTVNFTTAMPDADYSVGGICKPVSGGQAQDLMFSATVAPTTSAVTLVTSAGANGTQTAYDSDRVTIQIFR